MGLATREEKKNEYWVLGFLLVALLMWVSIIFLGSSKYVDESDHIRQIHRFMNGNYHVMSSITTVPGYHAVIAIVASMFGNPSPEQIRLISLVFSLLSIRIFYLSAKKLGAKDPYTRTLQYVFLPVSFVYFPLLYTDIFSLLLILAVLYFALSKRYTVSALFSLAALAVRQNNVVWIAFFWFYTYILENGFSFSLKKISTHIRDGAGYIVAGVLFLVFVWLNNGVAFGDQERHQVGFYMGNIYFFLVVLGVLFLPITISSLRKIDRIFFKQHIVPGMIIGIVLVSLFLIFPPGIHQYNLKLKFLRNIILSFGYHQYVWAYALAIFSGCLTLSLMTFERKSLILFPFVIAYLAPSFLVEQRYLIIPLVLILLFRKETNRRVEYANMIYFLLLSSGLIYMLLKIEIFF